MTPAATKIFSSVNTFNLLSFKMIYSPETLSSKSKSRICKTITNCKVALKKHLWSPLLSSKFSCLPSGTWVPLRKGFRVNNKWSWPKTSSLICCWLATSLGTSESPISSTNSRQGLFRTTCWTSRNFMNLMPITFWPHSHISHTPMTHSTITWPSILLWAKRN